MNASQNSGSSCKSSRLYLNPSISIGVSCNFFAWSCGKPEGFLLIRVFWGDLDYQKKRVIKKEDLKHNPRTFGWCGIQIGIHELDINFLAADGLQDLSKFDQLKSVDSCSFQRLKHDFPTEQPVEPESKGTYLFHQTKVKNIWSLEPPGRFFGQIFDWRERQSVEMAGAGMLWSFRWTTHHILAECLEIWAYLWMNLLPETVRSEN